MSSEAAGFFERQPGWMAVDNFSETSKRVDEQFPYAARAWDARAFPPISSMTGAGMACAADARPSLEDGGTRLGSHLPEKWSKGPIFHTAAWGTFFSR